MEGELIKISKKGGENTFKRWFRLTESALIQYKAKGDYTPRGKHIV